MEALKERIKRHEGLRLEPYRDDHGNWTIAFGHFMGLGRWQISPQVANLILDEDLHRVVFEYSALGWDLDQTRKEVILEMIFWFGFAGFLRFRKLIAAVEKEDWDTAADEMMDSRAGRNYKTRMTELADLMRG